MYKTKPKFKDLLGHSNYQVYYNGKPLVGYYFQVDNDVIKLVRYSDKVHRYITPNVSGKSKYPKVAVSVVGSKDRKTIHLHQLVAQSFHSYPIPDGVTKMEWARTPDSVKLHFEMHYWEANHIDHNHLNYHPNNLEWVSRGVNTEKYHIHRTTPIE